MIGEAGLARIREHMRDYLRAHGVEAAAAWPAHPAPRLERPVAAVSLRAVSGEPGGFQDYLGEQYDQGRGSWVELYGRRVRLVFGLDLYAPETCGAAGCQSAFDALAGALCAGGPPGLRVGELTRGETDYDRTLGLYHCPVECACGAYLYASAEEGGTFLDFEVKGVGRWN